MDRPDFSIKPKVSSVGSDIKSDLNERATAALSNLMGETVRIGEADVFEILNKVENYETETEYTYSQQKSIGQRPVPVFGGLELKTYSLNIKLHYEYCNPDDILKRLKEKAEAHEVFSYFQGENYIGEYVINRISENLLSQYKGITLYAEITVDILEYPDNQDEEFTQQDKKQKAVPENTKTVSKDKFKNPVEYVKNNTGEIFSTLTDQAIDKALRNAESYVNSSIGGITGGIL